MALAALGQKGGYGTVLLQKRGLPYAIGD